MYTIAELQNRFSLCCPRCRKPLDQAGQRCSGCGRPYTITKGVPSFLDADQESHARRDHQSDKENSFLAFFKQWPIFYKWMVLIVVPIYYTGLNAERFLSRTTEGQRLLNVGSGAILLHPQVLNVDLFPFRNVHVLANAELLPFSDQTFDAVCTDQVLEHVAHPKAVATELLRITKPGGLIYSATPFMYPFHPSPKDYTRWSVEGLAMLFDGHAAVESGVLIGPVSGTMSVLASGLAMIFSFGLTPLRKILHYVFMIVLTPLKLLDAIYAHLPGAEDVAGNVYVVIKK